MVRGQIRDVDALNEAWGTAFWSQHVNSFDEVLLPRHMGGDSMVNPPQQLDYERFGNDMLLDFYKAERDAIEEICPGKPFTTNFMVSTDQCTMNYAQWANEVDFVSNDHYFHEGESHLDELACSDALMDSLALGKPWYVMEHSTSAVQWKPLNTRKRAGELMRNSWPTWPWVPTPSTSSNGGNPHRVPRRSTPRWCPTRPDTNCFRGVCELGAALKTLSDAGVQDTELKRADTAILFSAESESATCSETLPSMKLNHWHDVRDWYRGYLDAGARADVVPLAYDWSGYQTIVLPTVITLSDEDTRRIADFAENGGTVIVGYATGLIDEHFHIGLGGTPAPATDFCATCSASAPKNSTSSVKKPKANRPKSVCPMVDDPSVADRHQFRSSRHSRACLLHQGRAAADWELDGVPAITSRPYGQGTAIYVGCDL